MANTTTNFRPAARAYSQRYRLVFVNRVSVSPECEGNSLIGCNVNAKRQVISSVVIGD